MSKELSTRIAFFYCASALSAVSFSFLSDRFYWRLPFVAAPRCLVTIGYTVVISFHGALQENIGGDFFAVILTCMGIYPIHPATTSWTANNLTPSSHRAIGLAFNICIGNIGGIIGSHMYLDSEEQKYYTGFGLSLAFGATGLIAAGVLELSYLWGNKRKEKMTGDEVREKYSDDELLAMGHKSPLFKYTL